MNYLGFSFTVLTSSETLFTSRLLWPHDAKSWLVGKDPDAGKDWGQEEKRATEDGMVGWHLWLNGQEFERTPGDSEGWGNLACSSPRSQKIGHNLRSEQVTKLLFCWYPCFSLFTQAVILSLLCQTKVSQFITFEQIFQYTELYGD